MSLLQGHAQQGKIDDQWFTPHWSVEYWRELTTMSLEQMPGLSVTAAEAAQNVRGAIASQDATSAAYWAYHTTRWAYFLVQGSASVVLSSARTGDLAKGRLLSTHGAEDAREPSTATWVRLRCRAGQSGSSHKPPASTSHECQTLRFRKPGIQHPRLSSACIVRCCMVTCHVHHFTSAAIRNAECNTSRAYANLCAAHVSGCALECTRSLCCHVALPSGSVSYAINASSSSVCVWMACCNAIAYSRPGYRTHLN